MVQCTLVVKHPTAITQLQDVAIIVNVRIGCRVVVFFHLFMVTKKHSKQTLSAVVPSILKHWYSQLLPNKLFIARKAGKKSLNSEID